MKSVTYDTTANCPADTRRHIDLLLEREIGNLRMDGVRNGAKFGVMMAEYRHGKYLNEPWILPWHKRQPRLGQNLEPKMNRPKESSQPSARENMKLSLAYLWRV